jgi:hypothetical protein
MSCISIPGSQWCRNDRGNVVECGDPTCGGAPVGAVPVSFTDALTQVVGGPGVGFSPGQCPITANGRCTNNPGSTNAADYFDCASIRECDPYTGMQHYEYAISGDQAMRNTNTWYMNANGTWQWLGANGAPTTPPSWATPPNLVSDTIFNPTVSQQLSTVGVIAGMQYNGMAGWRPALNSQPAERQPTIPAFTTPDNMAAFDAVTDNVGTASGTGPSQGGSNTTRNMVDPYQQRATVSRSGGDGMQGPYYSMPYPNAAPAGGMDKTTQMMMFGFGALIIVVLLLK